VFFNLGAKLGFIEYEPGIKIQSFCDVIWRDIHVCNRKWDKRDSI